MNPKTKNIVKKIVHSPIEPVFSLLWNILANTQILGLNIKWKLTGAPMPTADEVSFMRKNVTFIFKSFERKKMAKKLYRNIQRYYPGVKVIIADDSQKPLAIKSDYVKIIHLPFNSGLSKGLNEALKLVDTPFTIRMDDDELLTPYTSMHKHLDFMSKRTDIDLIGVLPYNASVPQNPKNHSKPYFAENMARAPKALKIPHGTFLDNNYVVLGKVPNIFIVRTEKYKALGYDDNIRMIDHFEFFFRASGNIVSALSLNSFVLHYHNPFDKHYRIFRGDINGDRIYIKNKYPSCFK